MLSSMKKRVMYSVVFVEGLQIVLLYFFSEPLLMTKQSGIVYANKPEQTVTDPTSKGFSLNQTNPNNEPEVGNPDCSSCNLYNVSIHDSSKDAYFKFFTNKYNLTTSNMTAPFIHEHNTKTYCHGNAVIFNNLFGILHDVTLHPTRRSNMAAQSKGGEEIRDVIGQTLKKEEYTFNSDFFVIKCAENMPSPKLNTKMAWMKSMTFDVTRKSINESFSDDSLKYTILVRRQDYANLHTWVRNIYNTFLIMMHFNLQPVNVSVMFMDGHPATDLDNAWSIIHGEPKRVGRLEQPVKYHNLILGFEENEGPMSNFRNTAVPFLEEFRSFVLSRFDLKSNSELNCKQLKITIILRRNAVYHPRNTEGKVGRKIFNEAEMTNAIMKAYPRACVKALLMESLPMRAQLDVIRQTDVLIGMHGAGMGHSVFLPKHAGLLELFAKNFKLKRPWYRCFQSVALWRKLSYETWENFNSALEMPHGYTVVPVDILLDKTKSLVNDICPNFER